jgi:two-component system cell cycle sensor histidine kinase/response regulator CckA
MRQITLLLADDDETMRHALRSIFENAGFSVVEAVDGRSALELAVERGGRIDLVVTDLRMPRMNGLELRERLRVMYPEIPIIFFSSYADEILSVYPELIVFRKPCNPNLLVLKIRELLKIAE